MSNNDFDLDKLIKDYSNISLESLSDNEYVTAVLSRAVEAVQDENKCDHGVSFDKEEAERIYSSTYANPLNLDPDVAFVMGSPAHGIIRKKWPRLDGPCPKGCGYVGIAYASYDHYIYGDW